MRTEDDVVEIDSLEKGLLSEPAVGVTGDEPVGFVFIAPDFGMGLGLPSRRYVLRKDFKSRKLIVTPNSIVIRVLAISFWFLLQGVTNPISYLTLVVSPSKSLKYDSFSYPLDNMLLQKLEEIDSKLKRGYKFISFMTSST